jgi:hypothetical protein
VGLGVGCVFLLVKPVSVTDLLVGIVTSKRIGGNLLVCVSEINVAHIVFIVDKIGIKGIVVPEVMLVIPTLPMALDHKVHELGHSVANKSPEGWAQQIEVTINGTELFVAGVGWETFIGIQVGECFLKGNEAVLHKTEGTKPEHCDSRAGEGSPLSVKIHLDSLVEDTVSTFNSITLDTLSEISRLFGQVLDLISGTASITLIETQEALVRTCGCHSN